MNWLYNLLLVIGAPIWVPWMIWRAKKRNEDVDWKQRTGEYRIQMRKGSKRIWIHAVSVGEVVASLPILREIRALEPEVEIVLSVTTSSGHQTATDKASELVDHIVYFPIDVGRFLLGAFLKFKPHVVVVMETELWMNFFQMAKNFGVPTMVVNGRVSDRSYPRSMKVKFFYKALLKNVDECLMQTETDASRIKDLGAAKAEVLGNCKFDEALEGTDADPADWRAKLGIKKGERVVVVGSTRGEMEEKFVLEALSRLSGKWDRVIHAPRHLERAGDLASAVSSKFGEVALRSKGESGKYLILDTYGELSQVYSVADVVVVGGGFDDLGGQNIIQPLAHGKPVIHGPHMQNFRDVAEMAAREGATRVAETPEDLAKALSDLLDDEGKRREMGSSAKAMVQAQVGASRRYAERIVAALRTSQAFQRDKPA